MSYYHIHNTYLHTSIDVLIQYTRIHCMRGGEQRADPPTVDRPLLPYK